MLVILCVYIYIYVHIYICTHIYTHTYTYIFMCSSVRMCMNVNLHIIHIHMCRIRHTFCSHIRTQASLGRPPIHGPFVGAPYSFPATFCGWLPCHGTLCTAPAPTKGRFKPQKNIQSPDRLYKATKRLYKDLKY